MTAKADKLYYYSPPLQPLLLWQSLALFWFCGLLAAKYPFMGFGSMVLFIAMDSRLWKGSHLAMIAAIFCCGIVAIVQNMPQRPAIPAWTLADSVPQNILLQGEVTHVQSLPNARLRIFLKNVHAVDDPQSKTLAGLTVWTWEQKTPFSWTRPLPGQYVRITAKVRSSEGFRNRWSSDFGAYWQNQEVFWRIWSRNNGGSPEVFGEPSAFAKAREFVRQQLYKALFWTDDIILKQSEEVEQGRAFLPALLMYERFGLSEQTMERMRAVSLVHSLALSGQHLWLAVYYAAVFVFCFRKIFPKIFLFLPKNKLMGLLCLPLALGYLWIGNAPVSLMRAALMLGIALIFYWRMQVVTPGLVLLCTALCITLFSPLSFYSLGLQLSVLCVGSICLMLPLLRRLSPSLPLERKTGKYAFVKYFFKRLYQGIIGIFCISLGIQCVLLPLFLSYFPPSGVWFFSNIFWLPVLAYWVLPLGALGMLCATVSFFPLANALLDMAAWPCTVLLHILALMEEGGLFYFPAVVRPSWTTVLAWIPLCVALALLAGRLSWHDICNKFNKTVKNPTPLPPLIRRLTLLAACLLCIGPLQRYGAYFSDSIELELLDVGQGQAVHITLPGGKNLLVDGGGSFSLRFDPGTDIVLPTLVYNAPPRLWAMVSTHPDVDHLRGLVHILPLVSVDYFYENGQPFSKTDKALWHKYAAIRPLPQPQRLFAGKELSLPVFGLQDVFLEVLWPPKSTPLRGNNASLVLRLVQQYGNQRIGIALLCGDAEKDVLQALVDSGKDLSAKVLILPHHGAKDGLLPEFYEKVAPQMALASSGRQNAFGHPSYAVQQALHAAQIPLYTTAKSGAIQVFWQRKTHILHMKKIIE